VKSETGELEIEIRKLVAKIIETDPEKITPDAHFIEDLGSDSMMALEIMAALEKKFGITIPEDQLVKIANLNQVTRLVNSLLPLSRK
jgi:acyl carrier protein